MKKFKMLCFITLFFTSGMLQAQFLNKLKKKVEERVEQTIIEKTADKAAEKTSNTIDKVFEINLGNGKKGEKFIPQDLPSNFEFNYQYRLTITSKEGALDLEYFLKPGEPYLGAKITAGVEMFMVMDGQNNINYMFMESGDNKIGTATQLDLSGIEEDEDFDLSAFTITNLPNRTFLGYDCIGKKMENKDYVFTMYFTPDAPVSLNDVFKSDSNRFPPALKSQLQQYEGALMMYMNMEDKKNKGKKNTSGTMECTLFQETNFSFSTSGYTFM